jgi:hypothetical protein
VEASDRSRRFLLLPVLLTSTPRRCVLSGSHRRALAAVRALLPANQMPEARRRSARVAAGKGRSRSGSPAARKPVKPAAAAQCHPSSTQNFGWAALAVAYYALYTMQQEGEALLTALHGSARTEKIVGEMKAGTDNTAKTVARPPATRQCGGRPPCRRHRPL